MNSVLKIAVSGLEDEKNPIYFIRKISKLLLLKLLFEGNNYLICVTVHITSFSKRHTSFLKQNKQEILVNSILKSTNFFY